MPNPLRKITHPDFLKSKVGEILWNVVLTASVGTITWYGGTLLGVGSKYFVAEDVALTTRLNEVLAAQLPKKRREVNYWLVVYQYQDNYSFRCRTKASVYPIGVKPKASNCAPTTGSQRGKIKDLHLGRKCSKIDLAAIDKTSELYLIWKSHGITSYASCPIFVKGTNNDFLWGYVGISYTEAKAPFKNQDGGYHEINTKIEKERVDKAKEISSEISAFFVKNLNLANIKLVPNF